MFEDISLVNIFYLSLGMWVLFRLFLSPILEKKIKAENGIDGIKQSAINNVISFGSLFLFLITISSGIMSTVQWYINSIDGKNIEKVKELEKYLNDFQSYENLLSGISAGLTLSTTFLLIIALLIISYRNGVKSFEEKLNNAVQEELSRLQQEYDNGSWEELPLTEEMKEISFIIDDYDHKIDELDDERDIEQLENDKNKLIDYLQSLDIKRRIKVDLKDEKVSQNPTLFEKITIFLTSKGLVNSFRKSSAVLTILLTLLLIPSLLTLSALPLTDVLGLKIEMTKQDIEKLKIELNLKDTKKELDEIISENKNKNTITEEDENVLDELSKNFENDIINARFYGQISQFAINAKIANNSIKEILLDEFSKTNKNLKVNSSQNTNNEILKESLHLEKKSISSNKPITKLGQKFKEDLKKNVFFKDENLWQHYKKLVKDATNSFQVPMGKREIKANLLSNAIGHIADGLNSDPYINKVAGISADVAKDFYNIESKKYMTELAKAKYMHDVTNKYNSSDSYTSIPKSSVDQLKSSMHNDNFKGIDNIHPSITLKDNQNTNNKATLLTKDIAKITNTTKSADFADALASFGDFFPGYDGQDGKTIKAKTTGKTAYKNSFSRSRSYSKLKGFSRIGGVLIGKMPSNNKSLNIIDFKWKSVDSRIQFILTDANNKKYNLGDFNPAIINQALAYVADGRTTTVTMISAKPLYDLKILLHPTLIDTGLGCKAIKLDQVADVTTSQNKEISILRQNENKRVDNFLLLYEYSWAIRIQQIASKNIDIVSQLTDYLKFAKEIERNYKTKIDSLLRDKEINFELANKKQEFFDKDLLTMIQNCKNNTQYNICIKQNTPDNISKNNPTWLYTTPKMQEWSGVREQDYNIDENLNFLKLKKDNKIWPLRFMVQKVFTTEPSFIDSKDTYSDSNPWEYLNVNKLLMNEIGNILNKNTFTSNIIRDMKEFTILQRFFRLAFENRLGEGFPKKKFIQLMKETKFKVNQNQRTLRWLPKPTVLRQIAQYEISSGKNKDEVLKVMQLKEELRKELGIYKDENQLKNSNNDICPKVSND